MHPSQKKQRGAALVVGLLLLTILTLLAVAGMNTASTELVMAGNEQFREGAFQAAEGGVEREIRNLRDVLTEGGLPLTRTATFGANNTSRATITYRDEGAARGSSEATFRAYHYDVTSVGQSSRNSTSTQIQGAYYTNQVGTDGRQRPLPGSSGSGALLTAP
jgi:type IV pilus assembly protein PilX